MHELWPHQAEALALSHRHDNLALLLDTGTGKTRSIIEILRGDFNKRKKFANTLIFAPLSVCSQWKEEFAKYSKIPQDRIHVLTQAGGTRKKYMEKLLQSTQGGIVVTNYEGVGIDSFYGKLMEWAPEILVFDEAHMLKNPASKRAKKIWPLARKARRRFILTGTLFANSMMDIYGPYKVMDSKHFGESFWSFRKKYFYDANSRMPKSVHFPNYIPHPTAEKEIAAIIAKSSIQAKKEDCLKLPPLLDIEVPVTMSRWQKKNYERMEKEFVAELNGATTISEFAMTVQLRCRQILAGFVQGIDGQIEYFDPNPRMEAVSDILDSIGRKNRTIIWTNFTPTYDKLGKLCDKMGIKYGFYTGGESIKDKELNKAAFKYGDLEVLISNPAAGGTGLDLPESSYSIYYDKSYNMLQYEQSKGRNYRGGSDQHEKVTHYHLTVPGTLDEVVYKALKNKQDLGKRMLEWARERKSLTSVRKSPIVET